MVWSESRMPSLLLKCRIWVDWIWMVSRRRVWPFILSRLSIRNEIQTKWSEVIRAVVGVAIVINARTHTRNEDSCRLFRLIFQRKNFATALHHHVPFSLSSATHVFVCVFGLSKCSSDAKKVKQFLFWMMFCCFFHPVVCFVMVVMMIGHHLCNVMTMMIFLYCFNLLPIDWPSGW